MQNETLKAIDKLREAVKIYPNSFRNNFAMGWLSMMANNYEAAIAYYTAASKLRPNSMEALNNLAVAQFFRKQYVQALMTFEKAAEVQDNKILAENLLAALAHSPPKTDKDSRVAKAVETAHLLQMKYAVNAPPEQLVSLPLPKASAKKSAMRRHLTGAGPDFYPRRWVDPHQPPCGERRQNPDGADW